MAFLKRAGKAEDVNQKPYTLSTFAVQAVMTVVAVLFLFPLFVILNYSFKTKKELYLTSPLKLPDSLQWANYETALKKLNLTTTFTNTFLYTVISVLILAFLCGITAWAISRGKGRIFQFSFIYFVIGILIPFQALFLPIYTIGYKMHLTNTRDRKSVV